MATQQVLALLITAIRLITSQPDTICVWDSTGAWDRYNGEYTKQATLWNSNTWWQQSVPNDNCPTSNTTKIFNMNYGDDDHWQLHTTLGSKWVPSYPDCEDKNIADPSLCSSNKWQIWNSLHIRTATMKWSVTADNCPTLPCGRIKIRNSHIDKCNRLFTKNSTSNYLYTFDTGSDYRYLYFNPWTFRWYCSDIDGHLDCDDDASITHQMWCSSAEGWQDTTTGSSFELQVSSDASVYSTATFTCLDTLDPTAQPTMSPTATKVNPTKAPSNQPTNAPTNKPTNAPTKSPSKQPIATVTNAPNESTEAPVLGTTSSTNTTAIKVSTLVTSVAITTEDGAQAVVITTKEEADKAQSDEDDAKKKKFMMIAIIAGAAVLLLLLIVCVICCVRRRRKRKYNEMHFGGAYDEFLKDSYDKDQIGTDNYHRL